MSPWDWRDTRTDARGRPSEVGVTVATWGQNTPERVKPKCDCVQHTLCPCDGKRCHLCQHDPRHGSSNAYTNLYCRCEPCRTANAHSVYDARQKWRARPQKDIPDHVHGTASGYDNYLCRCVPCTKANVEAQQWASPRSTDVKRGEVPGPKKRRPIASKRWTEKGK